ncbi:MAG: DedA family protein [Rhodobacteraceae bacterium]|nr:DedA family protein [Paracoccaceae bacterium]
MTGIVQDINALLDQYGLAAMFVSLSTEAIGLPMPGESAMLAAAALAGDGRFNIWHVAVVAWCAALVGDNTGYYLGRRLGRPTILTYGGRVGITGAHLDRAEQMLDRYGFFVVLSARFLPLLRQLNGLVAGTTQMRWRQFFVADMVGSAVWVAFWSIIGYKVGRIPGLVPDLFQHLKSVAHYVVPGLLVLIFVLTVWRVLFRRRAKTEGK